MKRVALVLAFMLYAVAAQAVEIKIGSTENIPVVMVNQTTGNATSGITTPNIFYLKQGGTPTNLTGFSWTQVDATNMTGLYTLQLTAGMTDTAGHLVVYVKNGGDMTFRYLAEVVANKETDTYTIAAAANATWTEAKANNLDAAISSRLANASYTAPDNTNITIINQTAAAIKARTDQLVFTTPYQVDARVITNSDKENYTITQAAADLVWNTDISALTGSKGGAYLKDLWDKKPAGSMLSDITWNGTRAAALDNVDVTVSSRLAAADYTDPTNSTFNATEKAGLKAALSIRANGTNETCLYEIIRQIKIHQ